MRLHNYILLLLLLCSGMNAAGQVMSGDTIVIVENTLKKISHNANFTIIPGPVYNTTNRFGFMIIPVLVYSMEREDTISPPSSSALMIYFDFSGSWLVAGKQNFYWKNDQWRGSVYAGYGKLKMRFYGVGRDTAVVGHEPNNYVWTSIDGFYASINCYRKIYSHLFGGLEYSYTYTDLRGTDSLSNEVLVKQNLSTGKSNESILVPSLLWDSRDNVYWSVKGYYAILNAQFASRIFLSSYDYRLLTGFINGYHRLFPDSDKLTLGWHFYFQSGWGNLPYFRMAIYGRGDMVTGYTRGKYVNKSEITFQTELRYEIKNFIAVGGYFGNGKVFSSIQTFGQSIWLPYAGARIYLNVMPKKNLRLRIDAALGRRDYGFYVGVGQGF